MANFLECPNCSTEIRWWRKLFLGNYGSLQCSSCSAKVAVSKAHSLALGFTEIFVIYLVGVRASQIDTEKKITVRGPHSKID